MRHRLMPLPRDHAIVSRCQAVLALPLAFAVLCAAEGGRAPDAADKPGAAPGGQFPRFFNAKTMRTVGAEDDISHGYAAFIPAARPTYDARMDVSLPLARRINAGYRLPNVFQPGEWAPLRRFCAAPRQEEDANGVLQSTRQFYQPVSWYTVLKALFGDASRPPCSACAAGVQTPASAAVRIKQGQPGAEAPGLTGTGSAWPGWGPAGLSRAAMLHPRRVL